MSNAKTGSKLAESLRRAKDTKGADEQPSAEALEVKQTVTAKPETEQAPTPAKAPAAQTAKTTAKKAPAKRAPARKAPVKKATETKTTAPKAQETANKAPVSKTETSTEQEEKPRRMMSSRRTWPD